MRKTDLHVELLLMNVMLIYGERQANVQFVIPMKVPVLRKQWAVIPY